jgi:uncharacterized membrane protein YhaH (DUF805 family)
MGAFGEFFGFDGRLDRLGFLWRSVAAATALILLSVSGSQLLLAVVRPLGEGRYELGTQALTVATVLAALWVSAALGSRRLRDIALEPAHIVPLYAALWVVNAVLLAPLSRQLPASFGLAEVGWLVLQIVAALGLLLWPGREAVAPQAHFDRAEPTAYLNWREGAR